MLWIMIILIYRIKNLLAFSFLIASIFLIQICANPKQPDLTSKEISYFNQLGKLYQCNITRSIEARLLPKYKTKDSGIYQIRLTYSSCDNISLDNLDSTGENIARELYVDVLEKSSLFDEIVVLFNCNYNENSFNSKYYHYSVDSIIHD